MDALPRWFIFVFRVIFGWLFFWDGLQKILNPEWSASSELLGASFLPDIFAWFADPVRIDIISSLNAWGLLVVGVLLIIGLRVRLAAIIGILLMVLYYFLNFLPPYASEVGLIVDRHIIYILGFLFLYLIDAGKAWGLEKRLVVRLKD